MTYFTSDPNEESESKPESDKGYYLADYLTDGQLNQLIDDQLQDDAVFLSIYGGDD